LGNLDLYYGFPYTYIDEKHKASAVVDFGLKYLALKKRLVISLTVSDIFKTNWQKWEKTINDIPLYYTNYSDVRSVMLSVSYRFGNNRISAKESKTSNVEEKARTN
jgi:hypothetical protein